MPKNLQRLSACMSTILAYLECPVCLDTIPPPSYQCDNGHLMCMKCRARSERCPICRLRLGRGRSLVSDQIYNAFTQAFNLREDSTEKRKIRLQQIFKPNANKNKNVPNIKVTDTHTHRLLSRILGKSSSDDNIASSSSTEFPSRQYFLTNELKTKSHSSNEINCTISPMLSRASSMQRLKKNENFLNVERAVSLHSSCQSLELEQDVFYKCPYDANCAQAIHRKF